jgi:hypothetical protein
MWIEPNRLRVWARRERRMPPRCPRRPTSALRSSSA